MQQSHSDGPNAVSGRNDYHVLTATEKQIQFAQQIAKLANIDLPADALVDRQRISRWLDAYRSEAPKLQFSNYPSSKQVGFAERIARMKRREVPQDCFRHLAMMSK
jgi:hypothetical protein